MKIKKLFCTILTVILIVSCFAVSVNAATRTTSNYDSSAMLAGSWHVEAAHSITTDFAQIYNGDVGVYSHKVNVGLSNAFARDYNRTMDVYLYEDDSVVDEKVKEYVKTFGLYNGYYRPITSIENEIKRKVIEYDSNAELYIQCRVNTVSTDTSRNIVANLLHYQFWIYT